MRARLVVAALTVGGVALTACDVDEAGVVTCAEDQVAVVDLARPGEEGLDWVCVTLDDFADQQARDNLKEILVGRQAAEDAKAAQVEAEKDGAS